jgi:UDP-N-acetylglucosamine transferase subunit ALG13
MIVVTTGTNEWAFDRLVRMAASVAGEERLYMQYGSSSERHGAGEWVDFTPFEVLEARMREARVVISHAGVGSIMLARRCGHRPVVLPRLGGLGEAVDDHQVELGRRLHDAGLVTFVEDEAAMLAAVHAGRTVEVALRVPDMAGADALAADLREVLTTLGVRPLALS